MLFLQGLSQSEIAYRTGISQPTVSRVIDEFERYVELNGLEEAAARYGTAEIVQELHSLSVLLSKAKLSVTEAREGAAIIKVFNEVGIDQADRRLLVKVLRRIEDPGTLQVLVELASLEEETGMTYEQILEEYRQLDNDVEKKRQEIHDLEERKMTLEKEVADAEAEARATDKRRSEAVEELRRTLKEKQLTIDKFNQLYSLVEDRVERMGWTKSVQDAVNLLDKAGGLIRFINALTDEEAEKRNIVEDLKREEVGLQQSINSMKNEKEDLRWEVAQLEERKQHLIDEYSLIFSLNNQAIQDTKREVAQWLGTKEEALAILNATKEAKTRLMDLESKCTTKEKEL